MSWYVDKVLPRLTDRMMRGPEMNALRAEATAGLTGTVVEIGFGSGLNLRYYPAGVERVLGVEPSSGARSLAAPRIAAAAVPVELIGLDGQRLPLDDASVDGALSTWTLCTIPDPGLALAELRRVLRPGGRFHFVEHGRHPDPKVERWQHRLDPVQRAIGGGCHLARDMDALVAGAGFELRELDHREVPGPRTHGYCSVGAAVSPA